jgi:hypothetical protein
MAQKHVTTANGKKLDLSLLKIQQANNTPIKNKKKVLVTTTENKNIIAPTTPKLKATVPSSAPVKVSEKPDDLANVITKLIAKKAKEDNNGQ